MVRRLATGKLREFAKLQNEHGVLLPLLHENMLEAFGPNLDRRADLMHPSDMSHGDWCPRAEYYKLTGVPMPEEKFNRVLENIFDEGYEIQYKWQRRMRATRKLWGRWLCQLCGADELGLEPDLMGCRNSHGHMWKYDEVPLLNEDIMVGGSADGAIDDYLVEIKSVGIGTMRIEAPKLLAKHYTHTTEGNKLYDLDSVWRELNRPFTAHVIQTQWYLWLAKQLGLPFTKVRFIYEYKWNQQVKEFDIAQSDAAIQPQLDNVADMLYALEVGEPPACIGSPPCKVCPVIERSLNGKNGTRTSIRSANGARKYDSSYAPAQSGNLAVTVGREAIRGPSQPATGRNVRVRQGDHGATPEANRLAQVPGRAGSTGSRGRTVRRQGNDQDNGAEGL